MVLGKRCGGLKVRKVRVKAEEIEELGFCRAKKAFGITGGDDDDDRVSTVITPARKRKSVDEISSYRSRSSPLECLPQDILVKVVCEVDHGDLKQLFHVSRSVREATLVAKETHFEYSTPSKIKAFRTPIEWKGEEADVYSEDTVAPNAPKQARRYLHRIRSGKLADISVALFASDEGSTTNGWPRRVLVMEPAA